MSAGTWGFPVRGSRRIYDGRVLAVRVDDVEMPGGDIVEREVAEHDRAVAIVVLDIARGDEEDPDVVMLEQYRHPFRRRFWELPAGLMDIEHEGPLQAAERELAEETGLAALDWAVLCDIAASPGFTDEAVRIFLARNISDIGRDGDAVHEEADLRLVRVPLSQAVVGVFDGTIVNASAVAGILAAAHAVAHPGALRPADQDWSHGAAIKNTAAEIAGAPGLAAATE